MVGQPNSAAGPNGCKEGRASLPGIEEDIVKPPLFRLARKERDAKRLSGAHFFRNLRQHRQATRNMEATDADRQTGGKERLRQVNRSRKLIGLHPHESN